MEPGGHGKPVVGDPSPLALPCRLALDFGEADTSVGFRLVLLQSFPCIEVACLIRLVVRTRDPHLEGSRLSQKILFIALALLPIIYVLSMIWAWRHRVGIRAKMKSGVSGLFSLWFPLLTTLVAAWAIFRLVPSIGGAPLGTIRLFQPDFGLALIATAVTGVMWAVFRLGVAYTGRSVPA